MLHHTNIRELDSGTRADSLQWNRPGEALVEVTAFHPTDDRNPWWTADIHLQIDRDEAPKLGVHKHPELSPDQPAFVCIETRGVTIYLTPQQAASLKEQL